MEVHSMADGNPAWNEPLFLKQLRGIVLNDVWPEMIFFTAVAVIVCCVSNFTSVTLSFAPSLLTVLGTALGLVLSFRTSSAYDRFWEGCKLWTTISTSSRSLATLIWVHVSNDHPSKSKSSLRDAISEKRHMIDLVKAFSVSLKHYLRGERGVYYEDLYRLIEFLPKYSSKVTAESASGVEEKNGGNGSDPGVDLPGFSPTHLGPASLAGPPGFFDYFPGLMPIQGLYMLFKRPNSGRRRMGRRNIWTGKKIQPSIADHKFDVPLEIMLYLSSYYNYLLAEGLLKPALGSLFNCDLRSLHDASSQLRRIASTPIPFAYQAHLRMAVWLYLFFLPFQIYAALGWITIPATTFASFLYLGFLEIGAEIENPFMYDENDLNVDSYCNSIAEEIAKIMAHNPGPPSGSFFSGLSQPAMPHGEHETSTKV